MEGSTEILSNIEVLPVHGGYNKLLSCDTQGH